MMIREAGGCDDAVVRGASGGVWLSAANVGAAGQGIHVTTKNEKSTIVARSCFYFFEMRCGTGGARGSRG